MNHLLLKARCCSFYSRTLSSHKFHRNTSTLASKLINEYGYKRLLISYLEKYSHLRRYIPCNYIEDNIPLGQWVSQKKEMKKENKLTIGDNIFFQTINFDWALVGTSWDKHYDMLVKFEKDHGHCRVPLKYQVPYDLAFKNNNKSKICHLGYWTNRQRKLYGLLSADRISQLNKLNFSWDPNKELWHAHYQMLLKFYLQYGHCEVPLNYKTPSSSSSSSSSSLSSSLSSSSSSSILNKDTVKLGQWVGTQRRSFMNNELKEDRKLLLTRINFSWHKPTSIWFYNFLLFRKYLEKTGQRKIPRNTVCQLDQKGELIIKYDESLKHITKEEEDANESGEHLNSKATDHVDIGGVGRTVRLGEWIKLQRTLYFRAEMPVRRVKKFDEVGYQFETQNQWSEYYQLLKTFYDKNGHSIVPLNFIVPVKQDPNKLVLDNDNDDIDDRKEVHCLGSWVNRQRRAFKLNKLNKTQLELLHKIDFVFDLIDYCWDQNFHKIEDFIKEQDVGGGELEIKKKYSYKGRGDTLLIRSWIATQRAAKKKGTLNPEREKRLDDIGFIW